MYSNADHRHPSHRCSRDLALALSLALCAACSTNHSGNPAPDLGVDASAGPAWDRPDSGPGGSGEPVEEGEYDCGEQLFELTESQESFEVPAEVRYMKVKAWGAGGNGQGAPNCPGCECQYYDGGLGGYSEAIFEVDPGAMLSVVVGQRGRSGTTNESPFRFGFGAHGGGGLTGVFTGDTEVAESGNDRALIIAGGGGSAGWEVCRPGGTGNHPDAGGQPTMHGQFGVNSDGDRDGFNGGGGGYHGGDGGGWAKPGKGGTGFIIDSAFEPVMEWSERGAITPPRTDDPHYDPVELPGSTERPGLLVVMFTCEYPGEEPPPEDDPPQVD